jgi:hypothetical protein
LNVTPETAGEHVRFAEQRLRALVAARLASHHADWQTKLSPGVTRSLEAIRNDERLARPQAPDEPNLLGYAGFNHLIKVCTSHWSCCIKDSKIWPSESVMTYELHRLNSIRNPTAHGRTVFPHEYIEGEGMARRLRTDIELLWRQEAQMSDQYWLYIESAEDSLGNRSGSGVQAFAIANPPTRIFVGDVIHFRVRAFDPLGRGMRFSLMTFASQRTPWQESPEFEWSAEPAHRSLDVRILVIADAEPHAMTDCDAFVDFRYEIRPRPA